MTIARRITAAGLGALLGCTPAFTGQPGTPGAGPERPTSSAREYLYVWTASSDSSEPDFLAVVDVTEDGAARYGRVITTLPVPGFRNVPHHTEHELAPDGRLFANGYASGQTYVFDVKDPTRPRLAARLGDVDGYTHPHSYLRLPTGNVLATFQMRHIGDSVAPGGILELTPDGRVVRASPAGAPGVDPNTRVYSAGIVPSIDRIVTTTTDMNEDYDASRQLQIWRLSDMSLLHTMTLPDGPEGGESRLTAEPRVLADGRTVLVSTFSCGLYLMEGLETSAPSARLVAAFPRKDRTYCAIPVVAGNYYLVTVPAWSAVVSLDVSDPAKPREVSRLTLRADDVPHWIALSPDRQRVVVTGYGTMRHRVVLARFDSTTGSLSLDERFGDQGSTEPGLRMDDKTWAHGGRAKGVPHGAVFGR